MENGCIGASDVDEEVVLVERLELDFHIRGLHDLIDLAVLLAADKLAMLVGQLNLEANLVMECLFRKHDQSVKIKTSVNIP